MVRLFFDCVYCSFVNQEVRKGLDSIISYRCNSYHVCFGSVLRKSGLKQGLGPVQLEPQISSKGSRYTGASLSFTLLPSGGY